MKLFNISDNETLNEKKQTSEAMLEKAFDSLGEIEISEDFTYISASQKQSIDMSSIDGGKSFFKTAASFNNIFS